MLYYDCTKLVNKYWTIDDLGKALVGLSRMKDMLPTRSKDGEDKDEDDEVEYHHILDTLLCIPFHFHYPHHTRSAHTISSSTTSSSSSSTSTPASTSASSASVSSMPTSTAFVACTEQFLHCMTLCLLNLSHSLEIYTLTHHSSSSRL